MALCRSCGTETMRVRTKFLNGTAHDECPNCQPQAFDAIKDPSTKKIWTGPEFAPNDYERRGNVLTMKPEAQQELEEKACGIKSVAAQEEREATERAIAQKRANRRTRPMTEAEQREALAKIDKFFRPMIEDPTTSYEV